MERHVETKEEKIKRLFESHNYLYKSMVKFGCYTKCHGALFAKIRKMLAEEGCYMDDDVVE